VHARGDDDPAQTSLDIEWQLPIRMMEEDRGEQAHLPDRQRQWRRADRDDLRDPPRCRQRELANVEADRRRCVQVEVDVMNRVESPERRHAPRSVLPPGEWGSRRESPSPDCARCAAARTPPFGAAAGVARESRASRTFPRRCRRIATAGSGKRWSPDRSGSAPRASCSWRLPDGAGRCCGNRMHVECTRGC